ncbi:MAG: Fe-S cluster assembly ATPase SufC [Spirochaetia bacterium]|nr:Fe-S cluster assembly ATPase SufC [Spirochaetia bacterium]
MPLLTIRNLASTVYDAAEEQNKQILNGVDLDINPGEIHMLMGTNGSGKSTLAHALMGHPHHTITAGSVQFQDKDLLAMKPDERARAGLYLAFQYPAAIPGLPVATFLKKATEARRNEEISVREFQKELRGLMGELEIPKSFLGRSLHDGFSGGEKKRMEVLQLNLLKPSLAILDETDSGLDIDALKLLFSNIREKTSEGRSLLIISHYDRILDYITPDYVHIMQAGKLVRSGGVELSRFIHSEGFEAAVH